MSAEGRGGVADDGVGSTEQDVLFSSCDARRQAAITVARSRSLCDRAKSLCDQAAGLRCAE